jgi:hypothetical protein
MASVAEMADLPCKHDRMINFEEASKRGGENRLRRRHDDDARWWID